MANIIDLTKLNNITEYPNSFKRQGSFPLERFSIFTSLEGTDDTAAKYYAANNPVAYVGQIVVVVEDNTVAAYVISSAAGDLIKLAQTTESGDLAKDINDLRTRIGNAEARILANEGNISTITSDLDKLEETVQSQALAIAALDAKLNGITAADNSIEIGGTATDPTIKVAISAVDGNTLEVKDDGLYVNVPEIDVPEYSIVKADSADEGFASTYYMTKDGQEVGSRINIPKDMVVSKGEIVILRDGDVEGYAAGTYIKLTIANTNNDILYINVSDLLDDMPVEGAADSDDATVVVTVDASTGKYVVTAALKEGSVATDYIADKAVTKGKLAEDIQTTLGKADTALQSDEVSIGSGAANGTVKLTVDGTETEAAVTGLKGAAYSEIANTISADATGVADAAKVHEAITDAVAVYRFTE